jgi:hypothetical protein
MPVNEITASRIEFALALSALGLNVKDHVDEITTPNSVTISPGSPYLEPQTVADRWLMKLDLVAVAPIGANRKMAEWIDALIEKLLSGMPDYATITNVSQPYGLQTNNAVFLAANISVEMRITL